MTSGASPKFPGHLRAAPSMGDAAFYLLLDKYDKYEPFVADCRRVRGKFGAFLPEPYRTTIDNTMATRKAIDELARRWNLHLVPDVVEFDYGILRNAVDQVGRQFGSITGTPFRPFGAITGRFVPENPSVQWHDRRWEWSLTSDESLGEFRDRIALDLDVVPQTLADELMEQLLACPDVARKLGWKLVDLPHGLGRHVHWLFLRLCPQPDRPLGIEAIASLNDERIDPRTVRRAVTALAQMMRIALPPLRVGRPRKPR